MRRASCSAGTGHRQPLVQAHTHVLALSAGVPGPVTPRGRKHTRLADLTTNVIPKKDPGLLGETAGSRAGAGHTGGLGAPHTRKWGITPRNQTRQGRRGSEGSVGCSKAQSPGVSPGAMV